MSEPEEPAHDGPDDDGPDDGLDDGADEGDDAGQGDATVEGGAPGDAPRKRRRRRRRKRGGGEHPPGPSQGQHQRTEAQRPPPQQPQRAHQQPQRPQGPRPQGQRDQRGRDRGRERRERRFGNDPRETRIEASGEHDLLSDDEPLHGDPYAGGMRPDQRTDVSASHPAIDTRASGLDGEDETAGEAQAVAWGSEDDGPAPAVVLAPDLPVEAPADDPDPVTFPLVDGPGAALGDDVASVVGVRFVPAGRIQWCDAGEGDYTPGDRVMVDSDRGPRLAWIATAPMRRAVRDRNLRRVIRRANEMDLRGERGDDAERVNALRIAKDKASALRLPLKVFRVEKSGGKLNVYYTSDERLDLRDFVRDVGQATGLRLELRQLGVRDEAKVVGGIGSCGLTLCCTTWLPEFVPVSIKMAKDQGLVLSPTKVSGQCGRLKCCLVYEQAGYAELRKGLPKLGKRVVSQRGEGRVVEVDVLRQRVRVSYGPGDTEVLPATDVKPMFPSGNRPEPEPEPEPEPDSEPGLPSS